ncbi:MAG: peptidyl-prolyl cis-trans isomerase [Candidatus Omnitrophica bacterium]|nr:peptidyl-prolyl cis-trans isomerase [Candidatus Omnitrophota bacterium]
MKKIKVFFSKWKSLILSLTIFILILGVAIFSIIMEKRKTVAVVNGYRITIDALVEKIKNSPEVYKEYSLIDPKIVIDDYINQILLFQYAKKYERKLRKKIESKMKNYYMEILTHEFVENILANKIKITEDEIKNYYNSHLEEFVVPERVQISEIVVSTKEKADEILERLKNGESFEKIAETESISSTREKRGEIGWIEVEKLEPEIASLIMNLKPGEVLANIIKTEMGYHIIKLTGRTEKRIMTLEEALPLIKNILLSQKKKIEVENLIKDLRGKGKVTINQDIIGVIKEKIK